MSGKCRNCGTDYGLHHYKTNQCPTFGKESPVGVKQEYQASVFAEGIPYGELLKQRDALLDALKQAVCGNMGWKGIAEDVIAQAEKEGENESTV